MPTGGTATRRQKSARPWNEPHRCSHVVVLVEEPLMRRHFRAMAVAGAYLLGIAVIVGGSLEIYWRWLR